MGCSEGRPVNSSSNFHSQILMVTNIMYQSNIITHLVDLKLNRIRKQVRMQSKTDRNANVNVSGMNINPPSFKMTNF
jgi:hypothetical protein